MKSRKRCRRNQRGSSAFEAVAALTILFFILFAMLQIYRWCRQRQFCQYSAYYACKGLALGYRPNLALRAARVAAIPISGEAEGSFSGSAVDAAEAYMVDGDASGVRYEYWHRNAGHSEPGIEFSGNAGKENCRARITLENAPIFEESALKKLLSIDRNPEPSAEVQSYNYSSIYMED